MLEDSHFSEIVCKRLKLDPRVIDLTEFFRARNIGHKRYVNKATVVPAHLARNLTDCLDKRLALMSPYQHGEVFVTDDGAETDLDLGHYEIATINGWLSMSPIVPPISVITTSAPLVLPTL